MLTEYIFELLKGNEVKLLNITSKSKNEAENELKRVYGKDADLKLIDLRRIIY